MATAKSANKATEKKETNTKPVKEDIIEDKVDNSLDDMKKFIEEQTKIIAQLQMQLASKPQQNVISLEGFDKVTVVHLKDYPTSIRLSNNKLVSLKKIKQTQEITRSEALELVNSFPKAFEKGWITFSGEIGQEILETNGVRIDEYKINEIFNYQNSISLSKDEIVNYYNGLMDAQKEMFVCWWYNEASSNKPEFLDIELVNGLNKASNGKFARLIKKITNEM